jgi:CBS domain-containing protein
MKKAAKRGVLDGLTARDLMVTDVQTLLADASIEEAIEIFEEYHISGAPVVDSAGCLLGVLTASDITRREHVSGGKLQPGNNEYYLANPLDEERDEESWEGEHHFSQTTYSGEVLGRTTVRDWMNPSIVSVAPERALQEICEVMVTEAIHRVLVVEKGVVKGIVSSFDLVRFLARQG